MDPHRRQAVAEREQSDDYKQLEQAIVHMEAQRATLGDAVVEASVTALRRQLAELEQAERASRPALRGERRLVTVMFADISGFTAMSETMDPETVRDLMNACFEHLVPVVERFGGTVDKFIGDEIMALFGAPIAHENDPERALRTALEMMSELSAFNLQHSTALGLHFGINTGHVIAGGLGTRERQEYSVMGDTVNLASRLEEVSERGEILVGPDTYRFTVPLFEFEALAPVRVKGKAEPVQIYRLVGARAVHGKVRGIEGLESPLVGRDDESRALCEAVQRLWSGVGGIVTVVGEAGLGKSRLVAEMREQTLARDSEPSPGRAAQWVEGRCLSYGGSIAYLLWLDVLRGLLGVTLDAAPLAVRDALQERAQVLCPDCADDVLPYLAQMMSLPLEEEVETKLRGLGAETLQYLTFHAVETLIERKAQEQPLVVVCEDLHWADPTSLALLERLLALTDRAPLLLICVLRPETEHGCWQIKETAARRYRHRHKDVWLDPLTADESETLVGNLLRIEDLPQALRDKILAHAEGNPFYVEEIIRTLIDRGAIVQDEDTGHWQATREVDDIALPDTLNGVLMARIDRLQEEAKRVLQLASVIGRVFFYRVLAEIAREERELDDRLLTLQREQMIRERARVPELEYVFKHELTREAAYNGLLRKERRIYHQHVAEALERLYRDRLEEQLGLLAHHWERAEEQEKAIECLLRAGEQARLAYANHEAIDYFRRAQSLLETRQRDEPLSLSAQIGEDLGDVLKLTGRQDEARVAYQRALVQTPREDWIRQSRLTRKVGLTWLDSVERLAACDQAETALEEAPTRTTEWWQEWVNVQIDRSWGYYSQARHAEMAELLEKVRPVVAQHGTPVQRHGFAQSYIGMKGRQERYAVNAEVLTICRDAVSAARALGDMRRVANAAFRLGFTLLWNGEFDKAEGALQEALTLGKHVGDTNVQLLSLTYLTVTYRKRGQILETRRHAVQSLDAATDGQRSAYIAMAQANLAWVAWQDRNLTEARELGQSALALWQAWDVAYPFQWAALYPLIGVALAEDRLREAVSHARALLDPTQQHLPETMVAVLGEAIEAWERDEAQATRACLGRVLTLAQELDYL
jgi:predicted ATPase/class 3 adenylate cyclase